MEAQSSVVPLFLLIIIPMMRIHLSILFLLFSLVSSAQEVAWQKMTPLAREAARVGQQDAQQAKSLGGNVKDRTLMAFVKTAEGQESALQEYGATTHYQSGSIAIAEIPLSRIAALSADARILRIEANRRAEIHMDTTATLLGADRVQEGLNLPQGYTGKGVVVGVEDIGFDLTHPTFWSRDMTRYRIKAMWDQLSLDTLQSALPAGRDYCDSLSLLTIAHPLDGLTQTHGTHTASTAAGSGMEGPETQSAYSGIAYESDIVLVANAVSNNVDLIPEDNYYKYTYALDALGFKYIFDYADSVGKPCVINLSEGASQDFYGYDVLYYAMLDELCGPGHIIVASIGNKGEMVTHGQKPAGMTQASIHMYSSGRSVAFTTKSSDSYTLRFGEIGADDRSYSVEDILSAPDSLLVDSFATDELQYTLMAQAYPSCYNADELVIDWYLYHQLSGRAMQAQVIIEGDGAEVDMFPVTGSMFNSSDDMPTDNTLSTQSPGSAPCVIGVGATGYRTSFTNYLGETLVYSCGEQGERVSYSSVGPTWDGRTKPDVMAPGQSVIAAYSSYYIENNPTASDISSDVRHFDYNGRTYAWNANSGTSMSAPIVTGIIALWLEAYPQLSPQDCLDIFSETCTHYDTSLSYPNNLYGYGQIDAYAGMQAVLELAATGITTVEAEAETADSIYTLDGICVGKDVSRLRKGIYIKGGKKFVVAD